MTNRSLIKIAAKFTAESPGNYISPENAISQEYSGLKIFDSPIFAFGSPDDEIYAKYKSPDVVGDHFLAPFEWLPSAKTVISFFLPYTKQVKFANAHDNTWPANEWLHGRYEGQIFLKSLATYVNQLLREAGYTSLIPADDPRYSTGSAATYFTSNWSERHIAYACGLGTFGLSGGIITPKGMCGRFGSILTELDLQKDNRPYSGIYDYCTMCGVCISQCPANAITLEKGKTHIPCSDFLDKVREKSSPRYGCGKCQVNVPCESGVPVTQKKGGKSQC